MAGGRPATPLALKLLANNPSKENLKQLQEETPDYVKIEPGETITPPAWMNENAQKWYVEIAEKMAGMEVLTQMDDLALELLITKYQHYRECYEFIERNGYSYETEDKEGNVKSNIYPEVGILDAAFTRVVALLTQFGWTPASRMKVKLPGKKKDPIADMARRPGRK